MKRCLLIFFGIVIFFTPATLQAEQKAPLGTYNVSVKLDYFNIIDEGDLIGAYIGLEVYRRIDENFYIGGEIGTASAGELFGSDFNLMPVELNAKYAKEFARNLILDFGTGVSYSHAEIDHEDSLFESGKSDDWLFGGQIFANLNYKIGRFFIGVNTKYQINQDLKDKSSWLNEKTYSFSNFRMGVQLGGFF